MCLVSTAMSKFLCHCLLSVSVLVSAQTEQTIQRAKDDMKDNKGQVCFRLFPFASPLGPLVGPAVAGPLSGSIQLPQASLPFGGPFCCQAPPPLCAGISFGVSVSSSHTPGIQESPFARHAGLTLLHVGKLCFLLPEF